MPVVDIELRAVLHNLLAVDDETEFLEVIVALHEAVADSVLLATRQVQYVEHDADDIAEELILTAEERHGDLGAD